MIPVTNSGKPLDTPPPAYSGGGTFSNASVMQKTVPRVHPEPVGSGDAQVKPNTSGDIHLEGALQKAFHNEAVNTAPAKQADYMDMMNPNMSPGEYRRLMNSANHFFDATESRMPKGWTNPNSRSTYGSRNLLPGVVSTESAINTTLGRDLLINRDFKPIRALLEFGENSAQKLGLPVSSLYENIGMGRAALLGKELAQEKVLEPDTLHAIREMSEGGSRVRRIRDIATSKGTFKSENAGDLLPERLRGLGAGPLRAQLAAKANELHNTSTNRAVHAFGDAMRAAEDSYNNPFKRMGRGLTSGKTLAELGLGTSLGAVLGGASGYGAGDGAMVGLGAGAGATLGRLLGSGITGSIRSVNPNAIGYDKDPLINIGGALLGGGVGAYLMKKRQDKKRKEREQEELMNAYYKGASEAPTFGWRKDASIKQAGPLPGRLARGAMALGLIPAMTGAGTVGAGLGALSDDPDFGAGKGFLTGAAVPAGALAGSMGAYQGIKKLAPRVGGKGRLLAALLGIQAGGWGAGLGTHALLKKESSDQSLIDRFSNGISYLTKPYVESINDFRKGDASLGQYLNAGWNGLGKWTNRMKTDLGNGIDDLKYHLGYSANQHWAGLKGDIKRSLQGANNKIRSVLGMAPMTTTPSGNYGPQRRLDYFMQTGQWY